MQDAVNRALRNSEMARLEAGRPDQPYKDSSAMPWAAAVLAVTFLAGLVAGVLLAMAF